MLLTIVLGLFVFWVLMAIIGAIGEDNPGCATLIVVVILLFALVRCMG